MAHEAPNHNADQIAEAKRKAHQLCQAYETVFGPENARTDAQKIVMRDLDHRGYINRPIFIPGTGGEMSTHRAAVTDGKRALVLEIKEFIRCAKVSDEPAQKPKAKTKRTT